MIKLNRQQDRDDRSETKVSRGRLSRSSVLRGAMVCLMAATVAWLPSDGHAQMPAPEGPPTKGELGLLPVYCPDTQGFGKYAAHGSPNGPKWVSMMGDTFWALHHYCLGILKFMRAQRPGYPPEIREGLLTSALGEFGFVVRAMPGDYILAPEIYTYIGRTYLLKNDPVEADAAFAKARTLKPDYWPAYSWLATYLADHGQKEKARAVVAEGLQHAPGSRTLQLIKQDLGSPNRASPPASRAER